MYILSNVPPAFDRETGQLNVYGGLAVAVVDSIPEQGATWAGLVTDPTDTAEVYDASSRVTRLPLTVKDVDQYRDHYSPWCKGTVYAGFHGLTEYAGLDGDKYARSPEELERLYQAHDAVIDDFAQQLVGKIRNKERFGASIEPVISHDYQLLLVAKKLKEHGLTDRKIGHYLHIPFPSPEDFAKIPHADDILDALLEHDFIGLQDNRHSLKNLMETVAERYPDAVFDPQSNMLAVGDRVISVKALPASINPNAVLEEVQTRKTDVPEVAEILAEADGRKIIFSAQRFDIIKGVPEALGAVEALLDSNPEAAQDNYFVFCCQPTRYEGVPCYDDYQQECLDVIDRIEDKYPGAFRLVGGLPREGVLQLMGHSDVMYVPTTIEGQNLVLKEFLVANVPDNVQSGVLVMTEGCGAYEGLQGTDGIFIHNARDVNEHLACLEKALSIVGTPEADRVLEQQAATVFNWTSTDYGQALAAEVYQPDRQALEPKEPANDRSGEPQIVRGGIATAVAYRA